jgi:hypothetical protein
MQRHNKEYCPVLYNRLTESELWMLRLGSPGEDQLDLMPGNVTGIPPGFHYHPFRFLDWKEEAWVQKQAAAKPVEQTSSTREGSANTTTTITKRQLQINYYYVNATAFHHPNLSPRLPHRSVSP